MTKIEIGSDNVFKDSGFVDPEERLAKSEITQRINNLIEKNDWAQSYCASVARLPMSKWSLIQNGSVCGFSIEELQKIEQCLLALEVYKQPIL